MGMPLVGVVRLSRVVPVVPAGGLEPRGKSSVTNSTTPASVMGDLFEALEKQQSATRNRVITNSNVNPKILALTARQYFKQADFSGAGRIDDDEGRIGVVHALLQKPQDAFLRFTYTL